MHVYLPIHEYIVVHVFCSLNVISYKAIYLYTTYKYACTLYIHLMYTYTLEHTIALVKYTFSAVAYKSLTQFEISVCSQY